MATPVRKRSATLARPTSESRPIVAVVLFLLGVFFLTSMAFRDAGQECFLRTTLESTFSIPSDSAVETTGTNPCGSFGAFVATLCFVFLGYGAFLIPTFLFVAGWLALNRRAHTLWPTKTLLMLGCTLLGAALLALFLGISAPMDGLTAFDPKGSGGMLGRFMYQRVLEPSVGDLGAWLILVPSYGFCLLGVLADDPKATLATWISELRDSFLDWNKNRREQNLRMAEAHRRDAEARKLALRMAETVKGSTLVAPIASAPLAQEELPVAIAPPVKVVNPDKVVIGNPDDNSDGVSGVLPPDEKKPKLKVDQDPKPQVTGKVSVTKPERIERATAAQLRKKTGNYIFPGLDLVTPPPPRDEAREDYRRRAGELIQTLREFRVEVVPVDPENGVDVGIQQGPSITRYEIKPAPGVRVERISGLQNNIAMNMKADAVRILAPVPGKGTVGIEIPNSRRQLVALREILESKAWVESDASIPVVLGVDSVTNKPVVQDLAKMPHALIAGSTGSGKSVCINTLLISMLYRMSPADLRLIMVDPKVVELQVYNEIPHLLVPVVTDPQKVPAALKWLISEMERRYRIFAAVNVRNLAGFNARITRDVEEAAKAKQEELNLTPDERAAAAEAVAEGPVAAVEIPKEKLPFIVCVIDEMADLMMVAAKDIETAVARIAQKARAAGIHMVLATQRPSTDVITGLIKANLPTRIAFKVAANVDSRTILDRSGAETLVGFGDMLFLPPGSASLQRVQGSFISDEDVSRIVAFIREKNGPPEFLSEVQDALDRANEPGEGGDSDGSGPSSDPMAAKAWEIIRTTRRASVSMLQRRLSIGYNRAARIMDNLEQEGYVGPDNGSSPREILREDG